MTDETRALAKISPQSEEYHRRRSEEYLHLVKTVTEYAQIALRSVLLANGAGATAILSFMGAAADNPNAVNLKALAVAGFIFSLGVAAGVLSSFLAYLSQSEVINEAKLKGDIIEFGKSRYRIPGIILAFVSLFIFVAGVLIAIFAYVG